MQIAMTLQDGLDVEIAWGQCKVNENTKAVGTVYMYHLQQQ